MARSVSNEFWARFEPLIPVRERPVDKDFKRKSGGGRKPIDPRMVLEGILLVFRTGCLWKELSKWEYGSGSAIHARYLEWERYGVFDEAWKLGLAECNEFEGIAWQWKNRFSDNPAEPTSSTRSWRPVLKRRRRASTEKSDS